MSYGRRPKGPAVIRDLEIKGFRGFRHVKLTGLEKVNIIVGDSGSGKTSLLEAINLACCAQPTSAVAILEKRSKVTVDMAGNVPYELAIIELMHGLEGPIELDSVGSDTLKRALHLHPTQEVPSPFRLAYNYGQSRHFPYELSVFDGNEMVKYKGSISNNMLLFSSVDGKDHVATPAISCLYLTHGGPAYEMTAIFAEMDQMGTLPNAIKTIKDQFKMVKEFKHSQNPIGATGIYVRLGTNPYMLPLHAVSDGLRSMLRIALVLSYAEQSVILIDEIENGIYYKRHEDLWKMVLSKCKSSKSQVFVTTHSKECLDAAAAVVERDPGSFSFIRAVNEGGESILRQFTGKQFSQAVADGYEAR